MKSGMANYQVSFLKILMLLMFCISVTTTQAQDFQYSLYHFTPLNVNPGMAGANDDQDAAMIYRGQKLGNELGLRSSQINVTHPLIGRKHRWGGIGLLISDDRSGDEAFFISQSVSGTFAYNLNLSGHSSLSFGTQVGYYLKKVSSEGWRTGSQWDGSGYVSGMPIGENFANLRAGNIHINTGFVFRKADTYNRESSLFGVAFGNLTNATEDFFGNSSPTPSTLIIHGSQTIYSNSLISLSPRMMYTNRAFRSFYNVGANLNYSLHHLGGGLIDGRGSVDFAVGYVNQKAAVLSFTINQPGFRFGFSYDLDLNSKSEVRPFMGATEFAVQFRKNLGFKKRSKKEIAVIPTDWPYYPDEFPAKRSELEPVEIKEEPTNKPYKKIEDFYYKNLYFDFNKALLPDENAVILLNHLADFLKENPDIMIKVVGHTDIVGGDEYNINLSFKRANAVSDFLAEKGIDKYRIIIEGRGAYNPILPNDTEENRAVNRRVEIVPVK